MNADDRDDAVGQALARLDGPRPIPAAVRQRVADALLVDAGGLPASLDRPRSVPSATAARIAAALVPQHPAVGPRRLRIGAAAAVVVLLLGVAAAATRPTDGEPDREVAADVSDRPIARPPVRPRPTTTSTSTTTSAPTDTAGAGATVVALDESEPAYARLDRFDSCDEVLAWIRTEAAAVVTEYGFGPIAVASPTAGAPGAAAPAGPSADASGTSGTNVQEAGVDEPDLVETDGRALYVVTDGQHVRAVSTDAAPQVLSSLAIGSDRRFIQGLVLDGTRLGVLATAYPDGKPSTEVFVLGVDDPASPTHLGAIALDGTYVDARATAHALHVVTRTWPGPFEFTYPADASEAERERALQANRHVVETSTLEQWLPPTVACESVRHPRDLSGFGATTVWTVPFDDPAAATGTAIVADAQFVYATSDRLVVATTAWEDVQPPSDPSAPPPSGVRTQLHRFALTPDGAQYLASGSVPGYVRSSYGLSEREGYLRVASTDAPPWWGPDRSGSSSVTVLAQDGDVLVPVGSVDGLGEEGEQIQGVRFVDDLAFVVTFRQTDPLYVIDLHDPRAPRRRGELHVTGFSGYLHPLGAGRLLGVGVEADESGTPRGGAVSVYDVSDLDRPVLAQRLEAAGTDYLARFDPHAFLLWEPTGLLVLPASVNSRDEFRGAADVFDVVDGSLTARGRVAHDEHAPGSMVLRAVHANGLLFTVGTGGVLASHPATLAETGWAGF